MTLTNFQWYVIAINIVAFLVYTIDFQIYNHIFDFENEPI